MSRGIRSTNRTLTRPAFTLVELILVAGMAALISLVAVGLLHNSYENWRLGSARSTVLQDGCSSMLQMVRLLRQTKGLVSVSTPDDQAGQITFATGALSGGLGQFRLNTQTQELEYGPPGSVSALVGPVTRLAFTCYDIHGDLVAEPVDPDRIQSVRLEATFADEQDSSVTFTLTDTALCRKDVQYLVINEIMYRPTGNPEAQCEWIELHNCGARPVNLNGWKIWTQDPTYSNVLGAHPKGNGSTIMPPSGYAIITTKNTKVTGVGINAIWLSTDTMKIGNGLGNTPSSIVTIMNATDQIDSVTYSPTWGGDGDGKSLARVDPYYADSDDLHNWQPGPINGTPGAAN